MKSITRILILFALTVCRGYSGLIADVTLNTSPLVSHPAGPFSLYFELNDGSFSGDANNSGQLTNFDFGSGGSASGVPVLTGGASGNPSTGITLIDSSPANSFLLDFVAGSSLSFRLNLSTNTDGVIFDSFIFSILDATLTPIPTEGGEFFDVLLAISIDGANPTTFTFASDPSREPLGAPGVPIFMDAPVVTVTPEPSTWLMSLAGFAMLTLTLKERKIHRLFTDGLARVFTLIRVSPSRLPFG